MSDRKLELKTLVLFETSIQTVTKCDILSPQKVILLASVVVWWMFGRLMGDARLKKTEVWSVTKLLYPPFAWCIPTRATKSTEELKAAARTCPRLG